MPTSRQNSEFFEIFTEEINDSDIYRRLLSKAIDWIGDNLSPQDVFSNEKLSNWAEENGYIEEI